MKVLITGADGFLGKNLKLHLAVRDNIEVVSFTRENRVEDLRDIVKRVDFVFHLAGVNRPQNPEEFFSGNVDLTSALSLALRDEVVESGRRVPVLYSSSIQADLDNPYGRSKHLAEEILEEAAARYQIPTYIFRLPNVFGKWCRPNYNSAVATFCHNIARGLPVQINDPSANIRLVYVEDVVRCFLDTMVCEDNVSKAVQLNVEPEYRITVGELAEQLSAFRESRSNLITERVGVGFTRALYSTYVSYLPVESFAYSVPKYGDPRGVFVEMLKTPETGQFSFFTAHPGITRGGHYHHSKTEKFLVIRGQARFKFRHMETGEAHELITSGEVPMIVETVPGWTHDITNIGEEEMIVMLWANEIFDRDHPDTFACPL